MYLLFKTLKRFFIGLSSSLKKWSVNGDSGELLQCDWMVVSEQQTSMLGSDSRHSS